MSDISDLYTTSEEVSTSDSKIVPSTSVPSSEQRSSIPIMSSSNESSESRESSSGTILSEESSDSIPTTFSTRYWSPSGMSSRHYTNSTETLVSDVVLSSVAGDETSESSVSVTSESVTSESVASESVTSESVASESVASESVTAVSDISDLYTTSEVVSTSDSNSGMSYSYTIE